MCYYITKWLQILQIYAEKVFIMSEKNNDVKEVKEVEEVQEVEEAQEKNINEELKEFNKEHNIKLDAPLVVHKKGDVSYEESTDAYEMNETHGGE